MLCGRALWGRLTDSAAKADDVAFQVARSPALRSKAQEIAGDLKARAAKADPVDLMGLLIEHAPTYGLRDLNAEGYQALFAVYLRALEPLPLEAVSAAFVQWTRDGNGFYPKPEQLFQRAEPVARDLWMAAYRIDKVLQVENRKPRQMTPEERARDRQAAIEAGIIDENGKPILNFKTIEARRVGPAGENRHQMADRLRRIADGREPLPTPSAPPPDHVEEAI